MAGITIEDLSEAAVWPGRANRNGKVVTGMLLAEKHLDLVEQFTWSNDRKGYHQATVPQHLRDELGMPSPGAKRSDSQWHCYAHRLIYRLEHGYWPTVSVDHIDRDKQNNLPLNLRLATRSAQNRNQTPRDDGSEPGVHWRKDRGMWRVRISGRDGFRRSYGFYDNLDDANAKSREVRSKLIAADAADSERLANGEGEGQRNLPAGVTNSGSRKNPFNANVHVTTDGKFRIVYLGIYPTVELAVAAREAAALHKANGCRDPELLKRAARFAAESLRKRREGGAA